MSSGGICATKACRSFAMSLKTFWYGSWRRSRLSEYEETPVCALYFSEYQCRPVASSTDTSSFTYSPSDFSMRPLMMTSVNASRDGITRTAPQ